MCGVPYRERRKHRHDMDSVLSAAAGQERVLGTEISISSGLDQTRKRPDPIGSNFNERKRRNEHGKRKRDGYVERDGYVKGDGYERPRRPSLYANQRGKERHHPLPSVCERRA